MGEKFGRVVEVAADSIQEVMQYLDANHQDVRKYLLDKTENQIGFKIQIADQYLTDEKEILLPLDRGDIVITPVPVGSKGAFKVIVGAILVVLALTNPMGWGALAVGIMQAAGLMLVSAGIAELMMPDPATDNQEDQKNY